jgi:hypothetical protein
LAASGRSGNKCSTYCGMSCGNANTCRCYSISRSRMAAPSTRRSRRSRAWRGSSSPTFPTLKVSVDSSLLDYLIITSVRTRWSSGCWRATAAPTHSSKRSRHSARQRFIPRPRNSTEMRPLDAGAKALALLEGRTVLVCLAFGGIHTALTPLCWHAVMFLSL